MAWKTLFGASLWCLTQSAAVLPPCVRQNTEYVISTGSNDEQRMYAWVGRPFVTFNLFRQVHSAFTTRYSVLVRKLFGCCSDRVDDTTFWWRAETVTPRDRAWTPTPKLQFDAPKPEVKLLDERAPATLPNSLTPSASGSPNVLESLQALIHFLQTNQDRLTSLEQRLVVLERASASSQKK